MRNWTLEAALLDLELAELDLEEEVSRLAQLEAVPNAVPAIAVAISQFEVRRRAIKVAQAKLEVDRLRTLA